MFSATANAMTTGCAFAQATFLDPNVVSALKGQIPFITGGLGTNDFPQNTAELFNPVTNQFTAIANPMKEAREAWRDPARMARCLSSAGSRTLTLKF